MKDLTKYEIQKQEALEKYNKIVSNKFKMNGIYELIELWNTTGDKRFKNLASEIVSEIFQSLWNKTNSDYAKYYNNEIYGVDFYKERTQAVINMYEYLIPRYNVQEKYEELWYIMTKLEIKGK